MGKHMDMLNRSYSPQQRVLLFKTQDHFTLFTTHPVLSNPVTTDPELQYYSNLTQKIGAFGPPSYGSNYYNIVALDNKLIILALGGFPDLQRSLNLNCIYSKESLSSPNLSQKCTIRFFFLKNDNIPYFLNKPYIGILYHFPYIYEIKVYWLV